MKILFCKSSKTARKKLLGKFTFSADVTKDPNFSENSVS